MQLERMDMNAENAYHATHDNSYLDITKEIKNVITNANLAYNATQLPLQFPEPTETVQFIHKVSPPNETKFPKIRFR